MSPNFPVKLLTVREAAALVRLSKSFLDKARLSGGGPAYVKAGARVLYDVADLTAWIASRKFAHTSEYTG